MFICSSKPQLISELNLSTNRTLWFFP
uniref:Uncharacterized protein n=1 Tax=Anguilla anguilla TaxID=7936 RepID=A0A0E9PFP2_ANGAN